MSEIVNKNLTESKDSYLNGKKNGNLNDSDYCNNNNIVVKAHDNHKVRCKFYLNCETIMQ